MGSGLAEKTAHLDSLLNLERIIDGDKNAPGQIRLYYLLNRFTYRRFHSRNGFMHFRVTKKIGVYSYADICYQPDTVSCYLQSGFHVLELGTGIGSNLLRIAIQHPDVELIGVDLCPGKPRNLPSNVRLLRRNYNDLSIFADNSFDAVFAVETIVHCSEAEKDSVFQEVFRVLKPGGVFLNWDYALTGPYESYQPLVQKAISLISKGTASAMIESADSWERHFRQANFVEERTTDLSKELMLDLKHMERKTHKVLDHPGLTHAMFHLLPSHIMNNGILGYLLYDAFSEGVIGYKEWVYRKPPVSP